LALALEAANNSSAVVIIFSAVVMGEICIYFQKK